MDKKEIKKDIIRKRIINFVSLVKTNSQYTLIFILGIILIIGLSILYSQNLEAKKVELNEENGLVFTDLLYGDKLIMDVVGNMPSGDAKFILTLNQNLVSNNLEKMKKDLNGYSLSNKNNKMFSSYVLLCQALIEEDSKIKVDKWKKAISTVPAYDIKASYSFGLIEYLIMKNKISDANKILIEVNAYRDKLDKTAKNGLDLLKGKIKMKL